MKRIAFISLLMLCALSCDRSTKPDFEITGAEHYRISDLKALCRRDHYAITSDILIRGSVTGNDLYGEFYKTLVVEDASGGISIFINHTSLSDDYPIGCVVEVRCNGLTLTDYGGKVILGGTPTDESVGYIAQRDLSPHLRCETFDEPLRPTVCNLDAIGQQQVDRYVCLADVHFTALTDWCERDPESGRRITTEHTIADPVGHTFTVRTLGGCTYAKEPVPSGTGSLYGIIDYFNGKYTLRIVDYRVLFTTVAGHPTAYLSAAEYSAPTPRR